MCKLPEFWYKADAHTHVCAPDAVVNIAPGDDPGDCRYFSVGVHPWEAAGYDRERFAAQIAPYLQDRRLVAIGESGLDRRRGPALDVQIPVFIDMVTLSEKLALPLIVHNVACTADLLAIRKRLRPRQPWIIHGFRGGPIEGRQLVDHGCLLSLGQHYNPAIPAVIPPAALLHETDTQQ